jgi:hypothetical protein
MAVGFVSFNSSKRPARAGAGCSENRGTTDKTYREEAAGRFARPSLQSFTPSVSTGDERESAGRIQLDDGNLRSVTATSHLPRRAAVRGVVRKGVQAAARHHLPALSLSKQRKRSPARKPCTAFSVLRQRRAASGSVRENSIFVRSKSLAMQRKVPASGLWICCG